jgi:hypothetical protein
MDVPRSPLSPSALAGAVLKHGKYVACGLAGIWWLDLGGVLRSIEAGTWGRPALVAHALLMGVTIVSSQWARRRGCGGEGRGW